MARLRTKKSSKKKSSGPNIRTGMSAKRLQKELKKTGGGGDPELLFLGDGDQALISFPTETEDWATYDRVYLGQGTGYQFYNPDVHVDKNPSQVTMAPVYVHRRYRAERKDFKALTEKNLGIRFLILNKETAEGFLRRAVRRNDTVRDRQWILERFGGGTDTKYEIERGDHKPPREVRATWRGYPKSAYEKIEEMWAAEQDDGDSSNNDDEDDFDIRKKSKKRGRSGSNSRKRSRSRR